MLTTVIDNRIALVYYCLSCAHTVKGVSVDDDGVGKTEKSYISVWLFCFVLFCFFPVLIVLGLTVGCDLLYVAGGQ